MPKNLNFTQVPLQGAEGEFRKRSSTNLIEGAFAKNLQVYHVETYESLVRSNVLIINGRRFKR